MNNVDIQEDAKDNISKLNAYLSEYNEEKVNCEGKYVLDLII